MSNDKNMIPNEDELWDVLSGGSKTQPAAEAVAEPEAAPVAEAPEAEAPVAEAPVVKEQKPAKSGKRIDGFFIGCMAGVAAVSVAATLLVGGMLGGNSSSGTSGTVNHDVAALEQENATLKAQLELQRQQILDLQTTLMDQMGAEEFLASASTDPSGSNEVLDAQVEAYQILAEIQTAYANFDREKLEELIPEMDARLQYLNSDSLNTYYLILEYVEQPSNG